MNKQLRRSLPILSMKVVMELTELTARQIRYYEDHGLITPHRTEGNRRLFSLEDVDSLLEIKDLLDQGINMAGIKKIVELNALPPSTLVQHTISDQQLRDALRVEMQQTGRFQRATLRQGDMYRFYH